MRRICIYPVFMALLLTVLAGCRREPLPETDGAILFAVGPDASVDLQTKATDGLPDESDFKGKAIALYGLATKGTAAETLFDGTAPTSRLTYSTALGKWTYSPTKYWNQGATYDFRAISPADAVVAGGTAAKSGSVQATFGDYDLMVASNHFSSPLASTASVAPVELTFAHAAAAVRFVFKKGANESRTCRIMQFQVDNLSASGTMTYAGYDTAAKDSVSWAPAAKGTGVFAWTAATDEDALELAGDSYKSFDGWQIAVPQTLGGATVRFKYQVGTDVMNAVLLIPDGGTWKPGMTYEYRIDIDKQAINLTFAANPWDATEVNGSITIR